MRTAGLTACLLAAVVALAPAAAAAGDDQLGSVLKRAQQLRDLQVTAEEEVALGAAVSERVRERYGVVQDQAVHRYVSLVGSLLAEKSRRPDITWQFIVLDTDGVNAFAAPGGFIHVTRGALGLVANEAELAGVLAHEMIHVTGKHAVKAIQKGKAIQLGAQETLTGNKAVFLRAVDSTTEVVMAGFGRSEEIESDREATKLTEAAGYDPHGLPAFLARISERNKAATEKQGLFASHPEMKERLEKIGRQIESERMVASITLEPRYHRHITYEPKPQAEIAAVAEGTSGLTGGGKGEATKPKEDEGATEAPKKKGFGLARLLKPGGEEKKSAQVTGSGASRGVDTERGAKGGPVKTAVTVALKAADIEAFRKEGNLR